MFRPNPASPGRPHLAAIDGLRGIAVLWIVLGHTLGKPMTTMAAPGSPFKYALGSYYLGVDLLFVVSGFVLFLPVATNGSIGDKRRYAVRRAARIVPAFYLFLLYTYFIARHVGMPRASIGTWVANIFFVHQETTSLSSTGFGINQAIWTMSVEVLFYVTLPFVAKAFYRRPGRGLAIAAAISLGWQTATRHIATIMPSLPPKQVLGVEDRMAHAFPSYTLHFALGMAAALLFVRIAQHGSIEQMRRFANPLVLASAVGVAAIAELIAWRSAHHTGGPIEWQDNLTARALLFTAVVFAAALVSTLVRWLFANSVTQLLGRVSYGMYLSHKPLIYLLSIRYGFDRQGVPLVAAVVAGSFLLGAASAVFIEEPIRRWVRTRRTSDDERPDADVITLSRPETRLAAERFLASSGASPRAKAS